MGDDASSEGWRSFSLTRQHSRPAVWSSVRLVHANANLRAICTVHALGLHVRSARAETNKRVCPCSSRGR